MTVHKVTKEHHACCKSTLIVLDSYHCTLCTHFGHLAIKSLYVSYMVLMLAKCNPYLHGGCANSAVYIIICVAGDLLFITCSGRSDIQIILIIA